MKKMLLALAIGFLAACGNESAENKPTDVDKTKNNDTSATKKDSINPKTLDSLDSAHKAVTK
jgi:uncharacterized lipoprotein